MSLALAVGVVLAVEAALSAAGPTISLQPLIGRSRQQVEASISAGRDTVEARFVAQSPNGQLEVFAPSDFNTADGCGLDVGDAPAGSQLLLVFEKGALAAVKTVDPLRAGPMPTGTTLGSGFTAWMEQPQTNALVAGAGELPLQRGFTDALARLPDATGDPFLLRHCRSHQPLAPRPSVGGERQADTAGLLQGLALTPFAWRLPALNAERERAAIEGPDALARLTVGVAVPDGIEGFAARHHAVYAEHGRDGYAVLVFNLGAPPSRNLSRMNAYAFVGVRDGVVEWVSRDGGPLNRLIAAGLCEGADRRPTAHRRGCTDYGFFSP